MKVDAVRKGNIVVVKCTGSLDAEHVAAFKKVVYDFYEKGNYRFVLDAEGVDFVDSMGLGVLISLLRRVKPHDGDIKIAALTPDVKMIFEITKLFRLFDVSDSVREAMAKFKDKK